MEQEPPGGLPAQEALLEFCDPSNLKAWESATFAVPTKPRTISTLEEGVNPKWLEYREAEGKKRDACRAVCRDFYGQLRAGRIVAFGYAGKMSASGPRELIAADRWEVLRAKEKRGWNDSTFEGGGQIFQLVRFHCAADLEIWREGAPLAFAIERMVPRDWQNYQAYYAPQNAPENLTREEKEIWGQDDREELWNLLYEAHRRGELILHALHPTGSPQATWVPISRDVLTLAKFAEADFVNSTAPLAGPGRVPVRVFLPRPMFDKPQYSDAGTATQQRKRPPGSAGAINKCRRWLNERTQKGPPEKNKTEYREEALKKIPGLSQRGFDSAWTQAVGDDPDWTKPGRKSRKFKH